MDKWEQVAREHMNIPPTVNYPGVGKLANLLRQCEADTIRRCASEVSAERHDWCTRYANLALSAAEERILSLLPKEPGQ